MSVETRVFEEVYNSYAQPIYNHALRLMGNVEDARDLAQEAFFKAFRAWSRMPEDLQVGSWLHRIATNACLDELRRRGVIKCFPLEKLPEWSVPPKLVDYNGPEQEVLRQEQAKAVQAALARLPSKYRTCLELAEYQGLSGKEIGEFFGISRGAVKSLGLRARNAFRKAYQGAA